MKFVRPALYLLFSLLVWTNGSAQVVAKFSANPIQACSPLIVNFINQSSNASTYKWDLGNGNTSTNKDPSAIYYKPGYYTVSLIAEDASGNRDTFEITNLRVFKNPIAGFTMDNSSICEGEQIEFSDNSTKGDTTIAVYSYDFGNGVVGASEKEIVRYSKAGKYDVGLHVIDRNGCEHDTILENAVTVKPKPNAAFSVSDSFSCSIPVSISFTNNSKRALPHFYQWDFGDGGSSKVANPSHSFAAFGNFRPQLIVIGSNGCRDTSYSPNQIKISELKADFKVEGSQCGPANIDFLNLTPADFPGLSYLWEFPNAGGKSSRHVTQKLSPGKHSIKLSVYSGFCFDEVTKEITITAKPKGELIFDPPFVCELPSDVKVTFSDSSLGGSWNYLWKDINADAVISNTPSAMRRILDSSYFKVSLNLEKDGCETNFQDSIKYGRPVVFIEKDSAACAPLLMNFKSKIDSEYPIEFLEWDFDDGTKSNERNPSHNFEEPDIYYVTLKVVDANGCTTTDEVKIKTGVKIEPEMWMDTSAVCNGDSISFENRTDEDPYSPSSYEWYLRGDKGDNFLGKPRDDFKHRAKFSPGKYTAFLVTVHNEACRDTFFFPDSLTVKAPLSVPFVILDSCGPSEVTLINASEGETSFEWFAPFAIQGSIADTVKEIFQPGYHLIGLATYNSETGCRDTTVEQIFIAGKPEVKLEIDADLDCPPIDVTVVAKTKYTGNLTLRIGGQDKRFTGTEQMPWQDYFNRSGLTKSFWIRYFASNSWGCRTYDSIFMESNAPVTKGNVIHTGKCLPYDLTLTDSLFGTDTFDRFWIIGNNDPIPVTSRTMTHKLQSKEFGVDTTVVKLRTGDMKCYTQQLFKIPMYGFDADLDIWHTDVWCDEVVYYMTAITGTSDTTEYQWGVNDEWPKPFGSLANFAARRPIDGIADTVKLRMRSKNGCMAEITKVLEDPDPPLDPAISADVKGSECPPLFVNFKDETKSKHKIVRWEWDLGDSVYSELQNPRRIYLKPGVYSISLTVEDETGCIRTVTYPDFITVKGPVAELKLFPKEGCAPHTVDFRGITDSSVKQIWDLGDGNLSNEQKFKHTYERPGTYIPLLTVEDTLGCIYTLPPEDTIVVTQLPPPTFVHDNHCAEAPTQFTYTGTLNEESLTRVYWDYGDGEKDTGEMVEHVYAKGGKYTVTITTENDQQCRESTEREVEITGADPSFKLSSPGACLGDTITITYTGSSDVPEEIAEWKIDDESLSHTRNSFDITLFEKAIRDITVTIITADGCYFTKTDSGALIFSDSSDLGMALIRRVSVIDDISIDVKIEDDNDPFVSKYNLWFVDGNGLSNVGQMDRLDDSIALSGLNTLERSYCMVISKVNFCESPQDIDSLIKHCTVELKAAGDSARNLLKWSPYVGWDNVKEYQILWREKDDTEPFKLLAVVDGNMRSYIDSITTCETEREYRIRAIEDGGFDELSFSDTAIAKPVFGFDVLPPEVWRASVENDQFILLEWVYPEQSVHPIDTIQIFRKNGSGAYQSWMYWDENLKDTVDRKVQVDELSYTYVLRSRDTCQNWSERSNVGKTVLLNAGFDKERYLPVLSWSAYEYWEEGVSHYLVEKMIPSGSFETIGVVPASDELIFTDESARSNCKPHYCYRVTAVRGYMNDSTYEVISHSNEDCSEVVSHLYVPNAFTMNKDGLNETFQPVGLYIKDYNLSVYNRWGELLFETDSCLGGWDGTYNGKSCQDGAYIYLITATGADNISHNQSGSFHLLR